MYNIIDMTHQTINTCICFFFKPFQVFLLPNVHLSGVQSNTAHKCVDCTPRCERLYCVSARTADYENYTVDCDFTPARN